MQTNRQQVSGIQILPFSVSITKRQKPNNLRLAQTVAGCQPFLHFIQWSLQRKVHRSLRQLGIGKEGNTWQERTYLVEVRLSLTNLEIILQETDRAFFDVQRAGRRRVLRRPAEMRIAFHIHIIQKRRIQMHLLAQINAHIQNNVRQFAFTFGQSRYAHGTIGKIKLSFKARQLKAIKQQTFVKGESGIYGAREKIALDFKILGYKIRSVIYGAKAIQSNAARQIIAALAHVAATFFNGSALPAENKLHHHIGNGRVNIFYFHRPRRNAYLAVQQRPRQSSRKRDTTLCCARCPFNII